MLRAACTAGTTLATEPAEALQASTISLLANAGCDGRGSRLPTWPSGAESDGEPFVAGPRTGRLTSDDDLQPGTPFPESRTVTFEVGDVELAFSSNLPLDRLRPILADLVPFDIRTQAIHRTEPPAG